jgi:transcriptional regulator with XRE-family HTH domain
VTADQGQAETRFGLLLRRHRLTRGLSQEELSELSGLSVRAIINMEHGITVRPYRDSVRALADALDLPGPQREQLVVASRRFADNSVAAGLAASGTPASEVRGKAASQGFSFGPASRATIAEEPEPGGSGRGPGLRQADAVTGPVTKFSVPPDTAAFVGRSAELRLIRQAALQASGSCAGSQVVTIEGMPGVGKTALAVRAARLLTQQYPGWHLFIDLHGHTPGREPVTSSDALAGLMAATGVDSRFMPADLEGRQGMWRDQMARQSAVLVLDNAGSSEQVAPLLPGARDCLVLVTSRRRLVDLPGAVVRVPADVLPADDAARMFSRLAPRAAGDAPGAVAELMGLAGCLPLAVSLLARVYARHQAWTMADLAAEIRAGLLTLSAEQASVAAAFEVSWHYLPPRERAFFACLGLHPGTSLDRYAAGALAAIPADDAAKLLDELHGEGLLAETSYRRYGMHDLIRGYVADRAEQTIAPEQRCRAMGRLLDYYQHTAACTEAQLAWLTKSPPTREPGGPPAAVPRLAADAR